jgi:TusA-related sulfurtransferase
MRTSQWIQRMDVASSLTIRSDDTNFAEAFDSACAQAGCTWSVHLNRKTGSISVIAATKKNKKG